MNSTTHAPQYRRAIVREQPAGMASLPLEGDSPMSGTKETPTPAQQGQDEVTDRSDENGQPWNDPVDEQEGEKRKKEQERSQRGEHSPIEPRH
jgi:hypothetical protein